MFEFEKVNPSRHYKVADIISGAIVDILNWDLFVR